jgi:hypothetical protein
LPMEYIRLGQHLWRPFKLQKQRNKLNLQRHKKHAERILKKHSVSCKLGLLLFMTWLIFGTRKLSTTTWHVVLFFTHMSIEDERDLNLEFFYDNVGSRVKPQTNPGHSQPFSWDVSANWKLGHAYSAQQWS